MSKRLTQRAEEDGVKAVWYGNSDVFLEGEAGYAEADKLAQYEDLGFTPEEIALLAKFYKEHTPVSSITADMKMVANSIELQRYKDLEKQGKLIELPCAVVDTVYCLAQYAEKGELADNFFINEIQISSFEFNRQLTLTIYDLDGIDYTLDDIFLTKEEAEAKLKELRGEQE